MAYNWYTEAMVEFTIAMIVFLVRVVARTRMVGFRGWKGDDYLVLLAMICYITYNIGFKTMYIGSKVKILPGVKPTPQQLHDVIASLRMNFITWFFYVTFIWSLKGAMLFFYSRLTANLGKSKFVRVAAGIVLVTYVVAMLEALLHCMPIDKKWRIDKYPGNRGVVCSTGLVNFYVAGLMNILTDCMLLCIPLPILWRVQLPTKRKMVVGLLLCSGAFVIIASTLRNVFGIVGVASRRTSLQAFVLSWSLREGFISILVVNAPAIKSLFTSATWIKSSRTGSNGSKSGTRPTAGKSVGLNTVGSARSRGFHGQNTLDGTRWTVIDEEAIPDDTDIEKGSIGSSNDRGRIFGQKMEIHTTTTVRVSDEEVDAPKTQGEGGQDHETRRSSRTEVDGTTAAISQVVGGPVVNEWDNKEKDCERRVVITGGARDH